MNNWATTKAGGTPASSIPGAGTDVVFQWDALTNAPVTTTLEQNFKINSLSFEPAFTNPLTGHPTSVTINPGTLSTSRLEVAPQVSTDGVQILAGGSPVVTINSMFKLGNHQTWNVFDSGSTLIFTNNITGVAGATNLIINGGASATGTIILRSAAGVATYTGSTSIVAGRLILEGGASDRLPVATALTLGAGSTSGILQLGDATNGASNSAVGNLGCRARLSMETQLFRMSLPFRLCRCWTT